MYSLFKGRNNQKVTCKRFLVKFHWIFVRNHESTFVQCQFSNKRQISLHSVFEFNGFSFKCQELCLYLYNYLFLQKIIRWEIKGISIIPSKKAWKSRPSSLCEQNQCDCNGALSGVRCTMDFIIPNFWLILVFHDEQSGQFCQIWNLTF